MSTLTLAESAFTAVHTAVTIQGTIEEQEAAIAEAKAAKERWIKALSAT